MGSDGEWICDDLERGTCVDATIMETRTSAAHPNNDKPQTIGDAQPITLFNAHHNMHPPHGCMVAERLNDHTVFGFTVCFYFQADTSGTTLCWSTA